MGSGELGRAEASLAGGMADASEAGVAVLTRL